MFDEGTGMGTAIPGDGSETASGSRVARGDGEGIGEWGVGTWVVGG